MTRVIALPERSPSGAIADCEAPIGFAKGVK